MKKNILTLFLLCIITFIGLSQSAEYVQQGEFQEKTKSIGYQMRSIKTNNAENTIAISNLESKSEQIEATANALKEKVVQNEKNVNSLKTKQQTIQTELTDYNNNCNMLAALFIGLFIVSLLLIFSVNKRQNKHTKELKGQLDETNHMLIEQGRSYEQKLAHITIELEKVKEEASDLTTKIKKLKKD